MIFFQKGRAKMGLKRSKLPKICPKCTKNKKKEKKKSKNVSKTCIKFPKID